jgi:hypothetical protein
MFRRAKRGLARSIASNRGKGGDMAMETACARLRPARKIRASSKATATERAPRLTSARAVFPALPRRAPKEKRGQERRQFGDGSICRFKDKPSRQNGNSALSRGYFHGRAASRQAKLSRLPKSRG